MFSPVLAANNNHMLDLLPNVYFISSLVHDEGSGKKKKGFIASSAGEELLTGDPDTSGRSARAQRPLAAGAI